MAHSYSKKCRAEKRTLSEEEGNIITELVKEGVFGGRHECGIPFVQRRCAHYCPLNPDANTSHCGHPQIRNTHELRPRKHAIIPPPELFSVLSEKTSLLISHSHPSWNKELKPFFLRYWAAVTGDFIQKREGMTLGRANAIMAALFSGKDPQHVLSRIHRYESQPDTLPDLIRQAAGRRNRQDSEFRNEEERQTARYKLAAKVARESAGRAMAMITAKGRPVTQTPEVVEEIKRKTHAIPLPDHWDEDETPDPQTTAAEGATGPTGPPSDDSGGTADPQEPAEEIPDDVGNDAIVVTDKDIEKALAKNNTGAAGFDGITWRDLQIIRQDPKASVILTQLINAIVNGRLPALALQVLGGGRSLAFEKPNGSVRPIVIPSTIHRLAGRVMMKRLNGAVKPATAPYQLAINTQSGMDSAIHTARAILAGHNNHIAASIDIKGAFSNVCRKAMHAAVNKIPSLTPLQPWLNKLYPASGERGPVIRMDDGQAVSMTKGISQGCCLSPALFSLTLHTAIEAAAASSPNVHTIAYIDDILLIGTPQETDKVTEDLETNLGTIGLQLAEEKCEVFVNNGSQQFRDDVGATSMLSKFPCKDHLVHLGAELGDPNEHLKKRIQELAEAAEQVKNLAQVDAQAAYILHKNCLSARAHHLTRTHAPTHTKNVLKDADEILISTATAIADTHHPGANPALGTESQPTNTREMLTLSAKKGGLGVRLPSHSCDTGWVAAAAATIHHATQREANDRTGIAFLDQITLDKPYGAELQAALNRIQTTCGSTDEKIPSNLTELRQSAPDTRQKALSTAVAKQRDEQILSSLSPSLKALAEHNSNTWSRAAWNSPADAPQVSSQVFSTALRLRLGLNITWTQKCLCGRVNPQPNHLLNCKKLSIFSCRHELGLKCIGHLLHKIGFQIRYEMPLSEMIPGAGQLRLDILARRGNQMMGLDFTQTTAHTLASKETEKRNKYGSLVESLEIPFHPIAISSTGSVGPLTSVWLDWLIGQLITCDHPTRPLNPRAFLSGSFVFNQALALLEGYSKTLAILSPAARFPFRFRRPC